MALVNIVTGIPSWIKRKKQEDLWRAEAKTADEHPGCRICFDEAEDPHMINITGCQHIFCEFCIKESAELQVSNGAEVRTFNMMVDQL